MTMAQTNVYNGLDTRVGSTTNSVANTYLRNGAYVTAPVIKDSNATFTPGISERRGTTTTFSHSGLKNADAQTGVSQTVAATKQYDAFGNLASSTGTWQGQFGYGGGFGYQQDATGLKLLGHRYYDSSTERFLTRDPIKDGRNWYVYCAGDPTNYFDSEGLALTTVHSRTGMHVLRDIAKEIAQEAVEEAVSRVLQSAFEGARADVNDGVYVYKQGDTLYVGQSNDIDRRLREHSANQGHKIGPFLRIEVPNGLEASSEKHRREFFEQFVIDYYQEKGYEVENVRNPVGTARRLSWAEEIGQWFRRILL